MSANSLLGPQRWRDQRWMVDVTIEALGIEFDQPRLGYYLGPVRDDQVHAEMLGLRTQVRKLSDLTPVASRLAERREALAGNAAGAGRAVTASTHWYAATQLWGLATYPIWENSEELLELHRRKSRAYLSWAAGVEHHVEAVEIPFRDSSLPAYFHLPPGYDGTPFPTIIACDGMDAGREFVVAQVGDEHLRRGFAVLAFDGPGQSEAATRGIYTSSEAWIEAGGALVEWLRNRKEVDENRLACNGVSFGSFYMSLIAATQPDVFRACSVALACFEPGCHTIFEEAGPAYKARHMWMAGMSDDEGGFDAMVKDYDLRKTIAGMSTPWFIVGGGEDELSPAHWVHDLAAQAPGPVSTLLYDDATHALTGSPSVLLGPPWRTEAIDFMADAVRLEPDQHEHRIHRRVTRTGQVVPDRPSGP